MLEKLTLCSVSYHNGLHLRINRELLEQSCDRASWLIVVNAPKGDPLLCDFWTVSGDPDRQRKNVVVPVGANTRRASWSHAGGLAWAVPYLKTRYILFLDPDFFIALPLTELLVHAQREGLAFFGAPYAYGVNVKNRKYYQGFPALFCMLVDTQQVPLGQLDFRPDPSQTSVVGETGYRIYERFAGLPHEVATFSPQPPAGLPELEGMRKGDWYFWRNKLFGVHVRAKMHSAHKTWGIQLAQKVGDQLEIVRTAFQQARAGRLRNPLDEVPGDAE
jgi:hypothetical protein